MNFLLIEDDVDIAEIVALVIKTRWPDALVQNAPTGGLGIEMARTESPNVVILDLGLPDIGGFQVCTVIREFSNVPIVMLTVRDRGEDVVKGLELGADDYITKPFKPDELLSRINAILRRAELGKMKDTEVNHGSVNITFIDGKVYANHEQIRLAPIEYQILYRLLTNQGQVLSRQALIDAIWGKEYAKAESLLDLSISRLKDRLRLYQPTRNLGLQEQDVGYMLAPIKRSTIG